jgi:hypothetical protein
VWLGVAIRQCYVLSKCTKEQYKGLQKKIDQKPNYDENSERRKAIMLPDIGAKASHVIAPHAFAWYESNYDELHDSRTQQQGMAVDTEKKKRNLQGDM